MQNVYCTKGVITMTNVKRSLRLFTVFALVATIVLSIFAVPASAAGVETWYKTDDYIYENQFTFKGYNLTPVKTMGASGTLHLIIAALELMDTSTYSTPMNFRFDVRSYSGTILYTHSETISSSQLSSAFFITVPVSYGQQIQIYTSAYDSVTGNYRTLKVEYAHWLT